MLAEFIKLPNEGETVGRFHLEKLLSTSILGNFYQAKDMANSADVLLHIIPEALKRADPGFPTKYKEEIERQKNLPAGPAMAVKEFIIKDGHMLALYKAGIYQNFNDMILDSSELMPEALVQKLILSVSKGLAEAEKIGQGHFFLTPDFLFFNKTGEVCIAGIGLFQSIDYPAFEHFVSGSLVPISIDKSKSFSALEILSPELRNFKTRDQRTDFFCLGMCAYFLLLGQKPERKRKLPREIREDICEGWNVVITRCLEPRPIDRYSNYRAFARDLENLEELSIPVTTERGKLHTLLEKIPVPHRLERRLGKRLLLRFRIAIMVFNVLLLGAAGLFLVKALLPEPGEGGVVRVEQVANPEKAAIILNIDPQMTVVEVKGAERGRFIARDGRLMLQGKPGKYSLSIKAAQRQPLELVIQVGQEVPVERSVRLSEEFASVRVEAEPGTEIYVAGKEDILLHVGTVGRSGSALLDNRLLSGTYEFVGLHDNYESVRLEPRKVSATTSTIQFDQKARPSSLALVSSPEGASVFIDGTLFGKTPILIEGLGTRDSMQVRIELAGYRPYIEEVGLTPGEGVRIDTGELVPMAGSVRYRLVLPARNPPPLAEIDFAVNGKAMPLQQSGTLNLPAGTYSFHLEHPDYVPLDKEIALDDAASISMDLVLEPRPVRLFAAVATAAPARILVNGTYVEPDLEGFIPLPANQSVTVEALVQNHLKVIQSFIGGPNERIDWNVPLKVIPGPEPGTDWELPYFNISMSWIGPGRFSMGSPVEENRRIPNEDNFTDVHITNGFWMARNEVRQAVYTKLMGENPSQFPGEDRPVDSVSWEMAVQFCERLSDFERQAGRLPDGFVYRLPTEAEWEYAARAGTNTAFSFGADADPSKGNFQGSYTQDSTEGQAADLRYGTLPVGSFPPNAWGLFDVHGNVAEWILDLYWDRHPGGSVENPYNGDKGEGHPIRGGSWEDPAYRVRSAARSSVAEGSRRNSIGFRVVLAPMVPVPAG